jgi:hypothetical protein
VYGSAVLGRLALAITALACGKPPEQVPMSDGGPVPDARPDTDGRSPDASPGGTPDLTVDLGKARIDLALRQKVFALDACELDADEDCIGGPGERRLLMFSVKTPNIGDGDLFLGRPDRDNPNFEYSECHAHDHFTGYANYRMMNEGGDEVAVGRKQAFCLLDSERYVTDDPTVALTGRYHCDYQGIQRGWADVYHAHLPCQFVDVTDLDPGNYTLEIELNAEQKLAELDYANNLATIEIDLEDPALSTPTEPCPDGIAPSASNGLARECGWTHAGTFPCTPGELNRVGCASACGLGTCTGDPVLRICDAARPDGNCSHPAAADMSEPGGGESNDFSGPCPCELSVTCPPSGELDVFHAPRVVGADYTCDIAIEE